MDILALEDGEKFRGEGLHFLSGALGSVERGELERNQRRVVVHAGREKRLADLFKAGDRPLAVSHPQGNPRLRPSQPDKVERPTELLAELGDLAQKGLCLALALNRR